MAAVQLAQHFGAHVYATAGASKWETLHALGLPPDHIASSRTLDFQHDLPTVDVVLNSLTGPYIDASLGRLNPGGRFLEMGKTDLRDPDQPGVTYRAFDFTEAGPDRINEMLTHLITLFGRGALRPLPTTAQDLRRAPEVFRHMSQAGHTGKLVLRVPPAIDPDGTVLITGGTGTLGALTAHHLAGTYHAKHLHLISRRGPEAPGAGQLTAELQAAGANVTITACDTTDRHALERLVAAIPPEHPLTAVIHCAATVDDAPITNLTPERLHTVLAAKVNSALNLHHVTRDHDLAAFITYSSAAGILGTPGQANYAAANAFLDSLAHHRHAHGLPATTLAWGHWQQASGLTGGLAATDLARLSRSGILPMPTDEALRLFDAWDSAKPLLVPVRLDMKALRDQEAAGALPPVLRDLAGTPARRTAAAPMSADGPSLAERLARLPEAERRSAVLELVRGHVATVLGHASSSEVDTDLTFKEIGFDSLAAVELRNRLSAATGERLPSTLIFDYPTSEDLAHFLLETLTPSGATGPLIAAGRIGPAGIRAVFTACGRPGPRESDHTPGATPGELERSTEFRSGDEFHGPAPGGNA